MNQKEYFLSKEHKISEKININNINRNNSLERKSNIKDKRNNSNVLSELNPEQISINKDSFIQGLTLVFIYFSVIIYSLLYMLAPEKTSNLIFEGNINSSSINFSLYNKNNLFYKLDTFRERENMTILEISKNFRYESVNDTKNDLTIEIIYSPNRTIINKIIIFNKNLSKEINKDLKVYHYYKVNDFPFWITLFNKENEDAMNITSDKLMNISFDI